MKKAMVVACLLATSVGCAKNPERLGSTYVSPIQYHPYDCDQLVAEKTRVERRVSELTGKQAKASKNDKVATGVGLVLFWPALFFLAGGDHEEELKRLKGEYEALEVVWIEKKCDDVISDPSGEDSVAPGDQVPQEEAVKGNAN